MAKLEPLHPTFSSPTGVFPSSVITLPMLRALDTWDDNFRITVSRQTEKRLVEYGLAVVKRWSVYITHAGINAISMFPNPEEYDPAKRPKPAHQTKTWQISTELVWRPNPRQRNEIRQDPSSMWKCSCGVYGSGATRAEARMTARWHREDPVKYPGQHPTV